jgi:hypothetical protein
MDQAYDVAPNTDLTPGGHPNSPILNDRKGA